MTKFLSDLEELRNDYPRIDEVKKAIIWELSKKPHSGEVLPNYPNMRVFLTYPIGSMPPFRVLYEYNPKNPGLVRIFAVSSSPIDDSIYY